MYINIYMDDLAYKTIESYSDWYEIREQLEAIKHEFPQHFKDIDAIIKAIGYYITAISKLQMQLKRKHSPALDMRIKENLSQANDLLITFQQHYMLLLISKK